MNGTVESEVSPDFSWSPEYDRILETLASSDYVQSDWNKLRDMIKYKLKQNIASYMSDPPPPPPPDPPAVHPVPPSASPQSASTITTLSPGVLSTTGAKFPPFPKREENRFIRNEFNSYGRAKTVLAEGEAKEMYEGICKLLHEFEGNPPFTVQRLCELIVRPRQHFKYAGKYLRAVERALLVTSTIDAFPVISIEENEASPSPFISVGSLREATTPLFSPIPFLHEDARRSRSRSRSRSPPMSPLNLATNSAGAAGVEPLTLGPAAAESVIGVGADTPAIGLVDELDDPGPGHLSDHPTALTATTTTTPTTATSATPVAVGSTTGETGADLRTSGTTSDAQVSATSGASGVGMTPRPMFGGSLQERFVKASSESEADMEVDLSSSSSALSSGRVESGDAADANGSAQSNTGNSVASDNNGMVVDEPDADKENLPKSS